MKDHQKPGCILQRLNVEAMPLTIISGVNVLGAVRKYSGPYRGRIVTLLENILGQILARVGMHKDIPGIVNHRKTHTRWQYCLH